MTSPRDAFLEQVRRAVAEGNARGSVPLPARGTIGYQGAGADPVARFGAELTAAGGVLHLVHDEAGAVAAVVALVRARAARRVLVGGGPVLDALPLAEALAAGEVEVVRAVEADRAAFFAADLGVSGVDYLIAETGSLVLASSPEVPRSVSLLPPVHVAVARREQVLPDLFDRLAPGRWPGGLPAGLALITGPSKTGDIELRLVTGVHGPGEVHVVLLS